jgi:hypothetical protein
MQIDLSSDLLDLDGNGVGKTLSSFVVDALMAPTKGDETLSGTQKLEMFALAQKIHGSHKSISVQAADIMLIKDRVGKLYPPLVVGRIYAALGEVS